MPLRHADEMHLQGQLLKQVPVPIQTRAECVQDIVEQRGRRVSDLQFLHTEPRRQVGRVLPDEMVASVDLAFSDRTHEVRESVTDCREASWKACRSIGPLRSKPQKI